MPLSRLQRFQAMVQDDLAKIAEQDKQTESRRAPPKPSEPDSEPGSEPEPKSGPELQDTAAVTVHADSPTDTPGISSFAQDRADQHPAQDIIDPTAEDLVQQLDELTVEADPEPIPQHTPQPCELEIGDRAAYDQIFVPILPFSKFPYKFLHGADGDRVAKKFFDQGKFWKRHWDLYYVWPPEGTSSDKPLILITLDQAKVLIGEINITFKFIDFRFTDYHYNVSLLFEIPDRALTPRYLGRSTSKDAYATMERRIPSPHHKSRKDEKFPPVEERTLENFKLKIEEARELNKARSKALKADKKQKRIVLQRGWNHQLKRTQRYLGLRQALTGNETPDESHSPDQPPDTRTDSKSPPINPELEAPFPYESSVVFVCVDVEAYEFDVNKITEVGIATLDTKDLVNVPPGEDGKNWFDKIRARHFRIDEYKHLNNSRHVAGCADRFEFGTSEFIRLADAPAVIASCFRPPFSADDPSTGRRNIVFVGHDPEADIRFLAKIGYNPLNLSNLRETIDTAKLHKAWRREPQSRSLGSCLYDLDFAGWNLHNGGNDAVYTLHVLLGICVRQATKRGTESAVEERQQVLQQRIEEAVAEAVQKVNDEHEGWSSDEDEDGGAPVKDLAALSLNGDGVGGRDRGRGRNNSPAFIPYPPQREESPSSTTYQRGGFKRGGRGGRSRGGSGAGSGSGTPSEHLPADWWAGP